MIKNNSYRSTQEINIFNINSDINNKENNKVKVVSALENNMWKSVAVNNKSFTFDGIVNTAVYVNNSLRVAVNNKRKNLVYGFLEDKPEKINYICEKIEHYHNLQFFLKPFYSNLIFVKHGYIEKPLPIIGDIILNEDGFEFCIGNSYELVLIDKSNNEFPEIVEKEYKNYLYYIKANYKEDFIVVLDCVKDSIISKSKWSNGSEIYDA